MQKQYEYNPVKYFVLTAIFTWVPWGAAYYLNVEHAMAGVGLLLSLMGLILGPFVAAIYMIRTSGSRALREDFRERLRNFRLWNPKYLLVTIFLMPVVTSLSIGISIAFGEPSDQYQLDREALSSVAMLVVAFVLAPAFEELGWRGYGVDALRSKMGMLKSSIVFGFLWSAWHAPLVLMPGTYQHELTEIGAIYVVNFFVSVLFAGIVANWLYYKHNRSITAGILLHSMLNATAVLVNAGQPAKTIATGVFAVLIVVILFADRAVMTEGERNFLEADG